MAFVKGVDVSVYQPVVDWSKLRAQGVRFAFVKATQGVGIVDSTFAKHWSGAKAAGVVRGAYHYLVVGQDAARQADLFLKTLGADHGELAPVLDVESKYNENAGNNQVVAAARAWLDKVEKALGVKPFIYSSYYYLRDHVCTPGSAAPPAWGKDHVLWLAQYPYNYQEGMLPLQPSGWQDWKFWQYSEQGKLSGVSGADGIPAPIDLDFFRGTEQELYTLAGRHAPQAEIYTVQAGDTIESIAQANGLDPLELLDANPNLLAAGTRLTIPVHGADGGMASGPADDSSGPVTYTIVPGDALVVIARRFNTTVDAICKLNNITNPNLIHAGQVLVIPA